MYNIRVKNKAQQNFKKENKVAVLSKKKKILQPTQLRWWCNPFTSPNNNPNKRPEQVHLEGNLKTLLVLPEINSCISNLFRYVESM